MVFDTTLCTPVKLLPGILHTLHKTRNTLPGCSWFAFTKILCVWVKSYVHNYIRYIHFLYGISSRNKKEKSKTKRKEWRKKIIFFSSFLMVLTRKKRIDKECHTYNRLFCPPFSCKKPECFSHKCKYFINMKGIRKSSSLSCVFDGG